MKVRITGAAGFIGSHTCERLLTRGDTLVGLYNLNDYYGVNLKLARLERLKAKPAFSFVRLDLADRAGIPALCARGTFDCVVHLDAQAGVRYSLENPLV